MSGLEVTPVHIKEGVWEGLVTGPETEPRLEVTHLGKALTNITLSECGEGEGWRLRVPIPPEHLFDGAQTFLICDAESSDILASFTIICGSAVSHDVRADLAVLRAEVDMLKKVIRAGARAIQTS